MAREITQRELRNDSGGIMRALDKGESFIVTRNGVPVGELVPLRRRRFVTAAAAVAAFEGALRIDPKQFRADVDRFRRRSILFPSMPLPRARTGTSTRRFAVRAARRGDGASPTS